MKIWIALWLIVATLFLVADVIWLKWLGRTFYAAEIGTLLRVPPNFLAVVLFYLLYVTGIVVFVLPPSALAQPIGQTALLAAFFGLVCYGTFDLTSLAVLKGFTARIAIIDMLWGAFATTVTVVLAMLIARLLPAGILAPN